MLHFVVHALVIAFDTRIQWRVGGMGGINGKAGTNIRSIVVHGLYPIVAILASIGVCILDHGQYKGMRV